MTGSRRYKDSLSRRRTTQVNDRRPVQDQSLEEMQRESEDLEQRLERRRMQRALNLEREERNIETLKSGIEDLASQVDETMSDDPVAFMKGVQQPGGE